MANDLDDLDRAKGGAQPPQGRERVTVELSHAPPRWPEHPAAAFAAAIRDSIDR
jgi:hypothetical protein